ncbi:MAG TPA: hypothetical protein VM265_07915 [Sphingomicrobium sp.]|jgi:hypothetical protein|nr:hypothetical protein [Sphingomicrobium sp.]
MSFAETLARQQQAVFDRLGEDATWTGVEDVVRVRRREADEELRFDRGAAVMGGHLIMVRRSEVADPVEGNQVQILDASGEPVPGALYALAGEPMLDRKGVWRCAVRPIAVEEE